jgi:predicted RNA-binding protein
MSAPHCWVIVASRDHVQIGKQAGVVQAHHGKAGALKRMKAGDMLLLYSPKMEFGGQEKCQSFIAVARVKDGPVYSFDMGGGFIPYRRAVEYLDCVEVPIQPLVPALSFIQNKQSWGYLFRFGFFEIPQSDFDLIARQMLGAEKELDV